MGQKMMACGYWKRKNDPKSLIKFFAVQNWGEAASYSLAFWRSAPLGGPFGDEVLECGNLVTIDLY